MEEVWEGMREGEGCVEGAFDCCGGIGRGEGPGTGISGPCSIQKWRSSSSSTSGNLCAPRSSSGSSAVDASLTLISDRRYRILSPGAPCGLHVRDRRLFSLSLATAAGSAALDGGKNSSSLLKRALPCKPRSP